MAIVNTRLLSYFLTNDKPVEPPPVTDDQADMIPTTLLSYGQHVGILLRTPPVFQPVPNGR